MRIDKKIYSAILILTLVVVLSSTLSCGIISAAIEDAAKDSEDVDSESFEYYEEVFAGEFIEEEIGAQEPADENEAVDKPEDSPEDSPVKFTGAILKKLDEVEKQYSPEFRQYLESLDKNYLDYLLKNDSEIKKEHDFFQWLNSFFEDCIIFTTSANTFPAEWYGSPINAQAENLAPEEIERSKKIIITALKKYPIEVLNYNLKKVYVLKSMNFFGADYGGTNSTDVVYVCNADVAMGYTDIYIEESFHHEFSSILLRNYRSSFNEQQWRDINPEEFQYFDESTGGWDAIKQGRSSKDFSPEFHSEGFLYEYAQSTLENDFNSFAENIFMGNEDFFTATDQYEKLKMKLDLIVSFYNSINPQFTIEYFRGL